MTARRPLLYSFRRCPYAIRARMALACAGVEVTLREVVLSRKPPQMLAVSSVGTVPILVLSEQEVLGESLDVMRWALAQNDPGHWLPDDGESSILCDQLIASNDNEFKYYLDRYKYFDRYPEHEQTFYRSKAEEFLQLLEARLSDHKFLLAESVSIADVAIFPFVRQFAFVDQDWFFSGRNKQLIGWLEYFLDSELFVSVMKKYPPWQVGQPDIVFP